MWGWTLPQLKTIPHRRRNAFTRVDLAAVGATLVALALLVFKATAGGQAPGHAATCLSNLRQLGQAWWMYAEDHHGRLVGNLDGGETISLANSNRTWVLGWLDDTGGTSFPAAYGGRANTNTLLLSQLSPLAPFANHDPTLFRCPADPGSAVGPQARGGGPRVRSISMNAYHGGRAWDSGFQLFTNLADFVVLPPAQSFNLIEENEASINDGFFLVSMAGFPNLQNTQAIDYPGSFHNGGVCLNFADGHAELKRWTDSRTILRPNIVLPPGGNQARNSDLFWLQERTTRKATPL